MPRMGNQFMPEFEVSKWTGKFYTEVKFKRTKYWNMHYTLIRRIKLYKIGWIKLLYYNYFYEFLAQIINKEQWHSKTYFEKNFTQEH